MRVRTRDTEGGFTLIEVSLVAFLIAVSLMSLSAFIFSLQKQNFNNRRDFSSHQMLLGRITQARQEFESVTEYLNYYGGAGVEFQLPPSQAGIYSGAIPRLRASGVPTGQPNLVNLEASMTYPLANGDDVTKVVALLHRCDSP